jgi:predicted RNA-binding Zn ribbon-like protein
METDATWSPLANLRIVAGNVALDFVNTTSGPRHGPADGEWLSSYEDFATWSRRVGIAAEAPVESPRRADSLAALARVLACRDDMYEIFRAIADGLPPPDQALRRLQLAYLEALAHGQLTSHGDGDGYEWRWDAARSLLAPLWTVVAAAVALLTHGPTDRIKSCNACRFLFIDLSKNGSRRWCSMEDCGKAAKIARYLQRRSDARLSGPATHEPPSPG